MNAKNIPQIDLDEVMAKIRAEINKNKIQQSSNYFSDFPQSQKKLLDLQALPRTPPFEIKQRGYYIGDFLGFHGGEFVNNAYVGILRREPDPEGYEFYLHNLKTGTMSKVEILGRLRFSPEGRTKGVRIKGLLHNFVIQNLFRAPIIGYFSRLFVGIFNLPAIIKNFQTFESYTQSRFLELQNQDSHNISSIRDSIDEISNQLSTINDLKAAIQRMDALELELNESRDILYRKVDRSELQEVATHKVDRSELQK